MSEKMRDEFEEWLIANTEFDTQRTAYAMTKEEDQQYMCHRTNLAWLAWQASRAALVVELPELKSFNASDEPDFAYEVAIDDIKCALDDAGVGYK